MMLQDVSERSCEHEAKGPQVQCTVFFIVESFVRWINQNKIPYATVPFLPFYRVAMH